MEEKFLSFLSYTSNDFTSAPLCLSDSNSSSKFLRAAIGPGLVETINIAQSSYLPFGSVVSVTGPALLAFDGERELYLKHNYSASMSIDRSGPPVVDISRCLSAARDAGFLSDAKIT